MNHHRVPWNQVSAGALVLDQAGVSHTVLARPCAGSVVLSSRPGAALAVRPDVLVTVLTPTEDEAVMLLRLTFNATEVRS